MTQGPIDEDIDKTRVPILVHVAAGIMALEGLFVFALGLQNTLFIRWAGIYAAVPFLMLALGPLFFIVAFSLGKARMWAVWTALALTAFLVLGSVAWLIISLASGVLSPLSLMVTVLAPVPMGLTAASAKACMEVAAARRRLAEQDMEFGL